MIPIRVKCEICSRDLGVFWEGLNDENELKPTCPEHGTENLRATANKNVVAFGFEYEDEFAADFYLKS